MQLEKGKVSSLGVILLIMGFVFGSSTIIPPGIMAGRDAWISASLGLGQALFFAWIYASLLNRFPGSTLVEISRSVFGTVLGGILSGSFLLYFFHVGSIVLTDNLDFIKLMILPNTPSEVVVFFTIITSIYAVKNGLEVIVRTAQVLVIISIIIFVVIQFLQINHIDFTNLKPFLTTPLPKLLWGGITSATFPFQSTAAFLMILPFLKKSEKVKFTLISGLLIGGIMLILNVIFMIILLGETMQLYTYPLYQAVKMINIADLLSRFEILVALSYFNMGYIRITVFLYIVSLGLAQIFKCTSYRPFVLPIGILMALISLYNFQNVLKDFEITNKGYPIYSAPFQIGVPLLVFLGAWIKGVRGGVKR